VPLPSPAAARGASNRRNRRTPSPDNSAPTGGPLTAEPALVAPTSIVPGVPSGKRTIRHATPPTRRRPSTASRSPHNGCCAAVTVTSSDSDERNSCSLCGRLFPAARPT
jgi:hypothetical protein